MPQKKVDLRNASKTHWHVTLDEDHSYPGDKNIELGCLMRIADATEKMASNYTQLQNDRDWYKKQYYEQQDSKNALLRKISAYKGVITKMKIKLSARGN